LRRANRPRTARACAPLSPCVCAGCQSGHCADHSKSHELSR
jgi:hypothetical protein